MHGRTVIVAAALLLVAGTAQQAPAQEASLRKCQALKSKVEQYIALRRKGGKASQMERWKRQRRESEEAFRRLDCSRYDSELRWR